MPETRKFKPSTNAVGEAIRAAIGEQVRPVLPGDESATTPESPPRAGEAPAAVTVRTFTFGTPARPKAISDAEASED